MFAFLSTKKGAPKSLAVGKSLGESVELRGSGVYFSRGKTCCIHPYRGWPVEGKGEKQPG